MKRTLAKALLVFIGASGSFYAPAFCQDSRPGSPLSLAQIKALIQCYARYVQQYPGEVEGIPGLGSAFYNGESDPQVLVSGFANPTERDVALARLYGAGDPQYVRVKSQTPIRSDTLFEIGSVTKIFTAATILFHKDRGAIDLDTRIDSWLPSLNRLPGANCEAEGTCPNLRQLLGMLSGIPNITGGFCTPPALCDPDKRPAVLDPIMSKGNQFWETWYTLEYLAATEALFPPGDRYDYSNTNYFLLGQVITQVENFFNLAEGYAPLTRNIGIHDVYLGGFQPIPDERRAPGWSREGNLRANSRSFSSQYRGAGGLLANPADVAEWIYELMTPGRMLSESSISEMRSFTSMSPIGPIDPEVPDFVVAGYGLGLASYQVHTPQRIVEVEGHVGLTGGFVSFAGFLPSRGLGFFLVINRRDTQNFFRLLCEVVSIIDNQTRSPYSSGRVEGAPYP